MVMVHLQFFQRLHQQEVVQVSVNKLQAEMVDQVVVLPITQPQVQVVKQLNHLNQVTQAHMDLEALADKLDQMDQVKVALVVVALVAQVEILTII